MRLEGKPSVVTGAAGGIGRAIALGFGREGAAVICLEIEAAGAKRVADEIREAGGRAEAVGCDITDFAAVERALGSPAGAGRTAARRPSRG